MIVEKNRTLLGTLHIALAAFCLLAGIIVFVTVVGAGALSGDPTAMRITSSIGTAIGLLLILLSLPGIIAGIGVLQDKRWGDYLAIIVGVMNLLNMPIGTIIGMYTLWFFWEDKERT